MIGLWVVKDSGPCFLVFQPWHLVFLRLFVLVQAMSHSAPRISMKLPYREERTHSAGCHWHPGLAQNWNWPPTLSDLALTSMPTIEPRNQPLLLALAQRC